MRVSYIVPYVAQASITLAILFAIYWLLLRKTTFYNINRIILILLIVLTGLLPVASLIVLNHSVPFGSLRIRSVSRKANSYFTAGPAFSKERTIAGAGNAKPGLTVGSLVGTIYCLGALFFLSRIIFALVAIRSIVHKGQKKDYKDHSVVLIEKDTPPFSFFRWIILNSEAYSGPQSHHILLHERVHVRQYHTLDILIMELFAAVCWFHPLAWKLKDLARLNLEYIADREMLRSGVSRKEYQYNLLHISFAHSLPRTANYFNHSHLKKRIAMMNISPSHSKALWKYLIFVPAVCLLTVVLAPINALSSEIKPGNRKIFLVIRKYVTDRQLKIFKDELAEDGIDVTFSDVTFYHGSYLSGIRMVVKQEGQTIGDLTVSGHDQPLSDPLVFYLLEDGRERSGVSLGYPKELSETDIQDLKTMTGHSSETTGN